MNRYERHTELLRLLAEHKQLEVEAVAEELGVSTATIRRDLDQLAEQRLLVRTRGGAAPADAAYDLPLRYKSMRDSAEKQRIGRAAAALVERGMVIGLNGGTTTTEVARALATRGDWADDGPGEEPSVTVVTNALNIANELAVRRHVKVVTTGGVAMPLSYELVGPLAGRILRDISLDIAFLGVDAIDPERGASARNEHEADINALLAGQADRLVVVADSSKLGAKAFARICGASAVDTLVTDDRDPKKAKEFEERGITVVQA
ncbi:DeoR/GlpR family DNA-binding transcription regulator [Streptomyces boluensis]|uniref:DeoR family transcriptional regulator n=1 Tax=Streptomyces boluensis TaxID=1775135 RepID=A0A964XJU4_9ACTN|nr:DeoR/GlpR family DNA-binding transcription regulator [Streptomyces boluensis]NBE50406.1 DeoR family transcriptional regulator [Streptomyces boluensis]